VNAVRTKVERPTPDCQGIPAADATLFIAARVDRQRWDPQEADAKFTSRKSDRGRAWAASARRAAPR
jgi:iron complex transport system substrate-binding protein